MNKGCSIKVQQLSKRVSDSTGEIVILDNISFSLDHGATLAITGSSGSGKSTLLGLLAGLDVPTSGTVNLLGHNLFDLTEEERAAIRSAHIGFVFQSFQLLPNLTALENVMLPLELSNKVARQDSIEMLKRVGLAQRLHHYPRTLSGGEQQRVSLARAFVMQPNILFADEPTGSLDSANGDKIINLMFDMHEEQQTTLVMVTHDPALAQMCGKQIKLNAGRQV